MHQNAALGVTKVQLIQRAEAVLACGVPHLHLRVVVTKAFGHAVDDGGFLLEGGELVIEVPLQERRLADSGIPQQNYF